MAWTKLDDTTVVADQPLSAFVGKRLTDNVTSYRSELQRATTFAYPTTSAGDAKVKWASYDGRRGTVVTVDCGIGASTFVFKVRYKTTNASIGGTLYVRDIDAGTFVSVPVPGSATTSVLTIPFGGTGGVFGLRGFHVAFQSDVSAARVGRVKINGAVANQVFCEPSSGTPFPFTLATGSYTEMYHLLKIAASSATPMPAYSPRLDYQVCAFRHNTNPARPPHGVLLVWPEIETSPAILTTDTTNNPQYDSDIFELGRLELFSITVENYWPPDTYLRVRPPLAYQQPTPITQLNDITDSAMVNLQPDACTNLTTGGFLGCVLPAGEEATFAFFVQTNKSVQQLLVSFRAVAYNPTQNAPDITFGVRDYQGNTVNNDATNLSMPVPRITGQTTVERQVGAAEFMNGVLAGDGLWGMRDAMDINNALIGYPVRLTWGPNTATEILQGSDGTTDAVYYGTITATADLYIYGFCCRVR